MRKLLLGAVCAVAMLPLVPGEAVSFPEVAMSGGNAPPTGYRSNSGRGPGPGGKRGSDRAKEKRRRKARALARARRCL